MRVSPAPSANARRTGRKVCMATRAARHGAVRCTTPHRGLFCVGGPTGNCARMCSLACPLACPSLVRRSPLQTTGVRKPNKQTNKQTKSSLACTPTCLFVCLFAWFVHICARLNPRVTDSCVCVCAMRAAYVSPAPAAAAPPQLGKPPHPDLPACALPPLPHNAQPGCFHSNRMAASPSWGCM